MHTPRRLIIEQQQRSTIDRKRRGAIPRRLATRTNITAEVSKAIEEALKAAIERAKDAFGTVPKFEGERPGMVFELGDPGLGYYADKGTLNLEELVKEDIAQVVKISLQSALNPPGGGAAKTERKAKTTCPIGTIAEQLAGGRKRQMSSELRVAGSMMWPTDWSVSKTVNTHVAHGLFPVDSINPNCWVGVTDHAGCSAEDALCSHETRMPAGPKIKESEQGLATSQWKVVISPCIATESGGNSAGVGVVVRSRMGMSSGAMEIMETSKTLRG